MENNKNTKNDQQTTATVEEKPVAKPKTGILNKFFPFKKTKEDKKDKGNDYKEVDSSTITSSEAINKFNEGLIDVKDLIAPAAIEVDFNHLAMGNKYFRTLFALGYPRFVGPNWLEPLINFEHALDISTFYYPVDSKEVMQKIKRKIAEMEATINADLEAGKIIDQNVKVALNDAKELQEQLAKGTEKFFHFALYITIHANTIKELDLISKSVEGTLGAIGVIIKPATLQQDSGFESAIPTCTDRLYVTRNMDTTSIATTFPFVSSELTMDEGIMYGINKYNRSLVIFDRFQLENYNSVIFAKSGSGKSYMVKLEILRGLMFGIESIVIDPEKEYETLCNAIGGSYISFSQDGSSKLNPFELSGLYDEGEDELRTKILSLHGLIKLMIGGEINSEEDAVLDRALILTYKEKGITPDPATHVNEAPLMEDLYKILKGMAEEAAHSLGSKLEKYIRGSAAGIFDQRSNVEINNTFTVFSIRDLSDELRPIAMYMMLEFIWTRIKKDKKKRFLVIDEAWWMMQYPDAARFLYSVAKRARKYYLGLTTITQDIDDFLSSDYGRAIIQNSSISIFLKQSPSSVDKLQKLFYLSDGEKNYLLSVGIGEGLFFAGSNHVALEVVSSSNEHKIITSNPEELERYAKEKIDKEMIDDKNKDVLSEAKVINQQSETQEPNLGGNLNTKIQEQNLSEPFNESVLKTAEDVEMEDKFVNTNDTFNQDENVAAGFEDSNDDIGNLAGNNEVVPDETEPIVVNPQSEVVEADLTTTVVPTPINSDEDISLHDESSQKEEIVDGTNVVPDTVTDQTEIESTNHEQVSEPVLDNNSDEDIPVSTVDPNRDKQKYVTKSGLSDIKKVIEDALIDESRDVLDKHEEDINKTAEVQTEKVIQEDVEDNIDATKALDTKQETEDKLEGKINLGSVMVDNVVKSDEVKEDDDIGKDPSHDLELLLKAEEELKKQEQIDPPVVPIKNDSK